MCLPFLSESLASPSCLTALDRGYRAHPITLLLHVSVDCLCINKRSKVGQQVHVVARNVGRLRATSTKAAAVRRSGETFLRESAPCCQIFSFFSRLFFFPPCCHSGFLTAAQRESVRSWVRKRKVSLPKAKFGRGSCGF